jgi:hypothetical protein
MSSTPSPSDIPESKRGRQDRVSLLRPKGSSSKTVRPKRASSVSTMSIQSFDLNEPSGGASDGNYIFFDSTIAVADSFQMSMIPMICATSTSGSQINNNHKRAKPRTDRVLFKKIQRWRRTIGKGRRRMEMLRARTKNRPVEENGLGVDAKNR